MKIYRFCYFAVSLHLYYLSRIKIDLFFQRVRTRRENSHSSFLFSLFHLLSSSASSTIRSVQFHLFLSLTAFFVYFIRFFFRLLTGRPNIRLRPLTAPPKISIILQRRFLIKLLQPQPATQPLLSSALCRPCCA